MGNYLLLNKLGQGQFGTVYRGVLIEDQKQVFAVKCIQKSKLESNSILNRLFQTEMHVMSKLNHPNIMHLYEFMETTHNYYLVIQYCNNGDLETYLKKMGKLSEEEAVYFLMQIMNAFQVLHKNKIMHRDVKLANIFLQDDRVVIGDFGFAKQGVDITRTKLGTPITMAPELLTGNGQSYNSKADLWSIGVCFYQILFGKTPFEAKSYDELKEKVRTQSGSRLKFPRDVPVSEECKNLLISLLQFDPVRRIEWKDFFNHALFELHAKSNQQKGLNNINNSMFDRQNETQIKYEFNNNKKTAAEDHTNLLLPDQLEKGEVKRRATEEISMKQDERIARIEREDAIEEAHKELKARYCHEKKKIIFIMYTVRKLRNLAKVRDVFDDFFCDRLMLSATLLLKKGLSMNNSAISSLETGINIFGLGEFKSFVRTEESARVKNNFLEDGKIYKTFSVQMYAKFDDEVRSRELRATFDSLKDLKENQLTFIDEELIKHFTYFRDRLNFLKLDPAFEQEYSCAILHFYYSVQSESALYFLKDGQPFEWKTFDFENRAEVARAVLTNKLFDLNVRSIRRIKMV